MSPLRIIPASDPIKVETIVLTIYGAPGLGKTTLGFSADAPLLLDTDQGAYRSAFRKDTAEAKSWSDISSITASDVRGYKTLVLDTAGRALDLLAADIIAGNPKLGRGGALTLQGYGELKSRFIAYLKLVRSFGLDVVLIAHSDEKQQGEETVERIDMQGASKQEVYKVSDAMGRLAMRNGQRVLSFSPSDTSFGKDPVQLGAMPVPSLDEAPSFLGRVIEQIKAGLNAMSDEQMAEQAKFSDWKLACDEASTADDFNALVPEAESKREKEYLHAKATAAGMTFDKKAKEYAASEPVAA